ncbi:MAG: hypothetical protein A3H57_03685 [Candidatus Taylorbacteria bacterium RIFCSPLOWO2_02_FULL_43_11]|uniref:Uncharacterized protein n=1 Tax=Candidatus Taylorbacteria bacterium RIFCSPHIGHO2_02_FULL_43_32b TaxID=1802306 RepID=A0A1G2MP66_9BACT|nr:MAG: hypothetical protein A2743_04625 [Candidatus Taylorbacteria bacterium RIFCSPHIGHO2_01_FULL_43_47]OHA24821.1 MAG: hypothetical protein A3C72_03250 [Candidatus Taylorbacteria bacterium RIFCSPHIGHO2_02_FULL_43_32b]OHA35655.1 MAG: hypothetical protein A3H57_03685 [Candidatus Taylorbacteria bacterium RIFCSPLOWO2_02_FULL_43_11]
MLAIPEFMFYASSVAVIIVAIMLSIFLYFGIRIAINVKAVSEVLKREGEKMEKTTQSLRRIINIFTSTVIGSLIFRKNKKN